MDGVIDCLKKKDFVKFGDDQVEFNSYRFAKQPNTCDNKY